MFNLNVMFYKNASLQCCDQFRSIRLGDLDLRKLPKAILSFIYDAAYIPKPGFSSKFDNIILLPIQIEETHSFKITPR